MRSRIVLAWILATILASAGLAGAAAEESLRGNPQGAAILCFTPFSPGSDHLSAILRSMKTHLSESGCPPSVHLEHIDAVALRTSSSYFGEELASAARRFGAISFDIIVAAGESAFDLAMAYRSECAHSLAVYGFYLYRQRPSERPNAYGRVLDTSISGTLDLALRLFPGTDTLVVVTSPIISGNSGLMSAFRAYPSIKLREAVNPGFGELGRLSGQRGERR